MKNWLYENTYKNFPPLWISITINIILVGLICGSFIIVNKIESRRPPPLLYFYHEHDMHILTDETVNKAVIDYNCTDNINVEIATRNNSYVICFTCRQIVDRSIQGVHLTMFMYLFYGFISEVVLVLSSMAFTVCFFFFLPGSIHVYFKKWQWPRMESISYI
jgi:hypothetical protein